jgi:glycerophosphoryl diester phosphodiesterase
LSLLRLLDDRLAPPPEPRKLAWLIGARFAHRGLHSATVPENSPAAFVAALDSGLGIECDIQRSRDGQAMVFHDFELDRLTGERGPIDGRTAQELGRTTLSNGEGIPTLRQLLDRVAGKVPLLIEVKTRRERPVAALCLAVKRSLEGYLGPHAVMGFDPRVSRWFARQSPFTVRGLVISEGDDRALSGAIKRRLSLWSARPDFLAYDIRDLPSRLASAQRARGLPVATWTVRTPEQRERAAAHADAPIAEGAGVG